jgi:hypothetical protein
MCLAFAAFQSLPVDERPRQSISCCFFRQLCDPLTLQAFAIFQLFHPKKQTPNHQSSPCIMATDRLIHEVRTGDVPKIDAGNFFWRPVERASTLHARVVNSGPNVGPNAGPNAGTNAGTNGANQKPIAQQLLERPDLKTPTALGKEFFPLDVLQDRTFAGTGYNTIWRPRSKIPLEKVNGTQDDVLELNLTAETLTFSKSLGDVPNRGVKAQKDLVLKGLSYVQRVGAFEDTGSGRNDSKDPAGIHFEPGVLMFVPPSDKQPAMINRMASIPHGTTINAQGLVSKIIRSKGNPQKFIDPVSIIPFSVGSLDTKDDEVSGPFADQLSFPGKDENSRLPSSLSLFRGI